VLQTLNLHCEEVENGKVAVDYFKQGRIYDLVFMDKEMPLMDGHEVDQFSSLVSIS
jgi:CheY-like chemotaxis protein